MIAQFALRLICGLSLMWCLSRRSEITSGFFRIQMLVTLGLSVLAALTSGQLTHGQTLVFSLALGLGVISFLGSVMWTLERRRAGMVFAGLILAGSLSGLVALAWVTPHGSGPELARNVGESLSSAALFGAVTATMLLGHWYLTATGMPLSPLIHFNRLFCGAVLLRTGFALWTATAMTEPLTAGGGLMLLRGAGLAGPLLLGLLTMQILKYRNTQSATGVLYAATILVFMGEMAAALLGASPGAM